MPRKKKGSKKDKVGSNLLQLHRGKTPSNNNGRIEEVYLDCCGAKRWFRFDTLESSTRGLLRAVEIRDGEETGWTFSEPFDLDYDVPPYFELRERIRERLAQRDVALDPETGKLALLSDLLRAQIVGVDGEDGPELVVDGDAMSWEEFGALLSDLGGHGLRVEIVPAGEE